MKIDSILERLGLSKLSEGQAKAAMAIGLAAIAIIGVASLLSETESPASGFQNKEDIQHTVSSEPSSDSELDELTQYTKELETRVCDTLTRVKGAGAVWVTISMEHSESQVFATNSSTQKRTVSERDSSGGVKSTTESTTTATVVTMRKAGEEDGPVLVRKLVPKVAGVLVVAEGAVDLAVRYELMQATATLLDIPPHRILVTGAEGG